MNSSLSQFMLATLAAATMGSALAQSDPMSNPGSQVIVRSAGTGYTPSGPAPQFSELDVDGNGSIDEGEAVGYKLLANDFRMADSNRDGRISKREYERWTSMP
ncbi:MAG: hypothetical protein IPH43_10525 [Xanthomonadales bacterium]|uniref:hypothetical protein n=1 Tax=Dokdonella sp. TaxID=2291710 RepID=UPI002B785990|nr:hypothetical protein [Xanthomonadales bacterium]HQW76559.1 hypothetical protein [Dokdonella sp.]MBK7208824.1 hypothetical protein [Xanthomonadales bacterium]MBL0221855.1 hypothetical protein [Xanthomonadales bacterium]HQY54808.1 hypothetical protein [Dokdonella sp.]